MALNLLLIESDPDFAATLATELAAFGHRIDRETNGRDALLAVETRSYDAAILDWAPPRLDGIAVLRRLRDSAMTLPVIMLSARGRSVDKIEGLEAGADDYVVKPASAAELDARIRAALRGRAWNSARGDTIRAGDIVVSPSRVRAWRGEAAIDLAPIEFAILAELVRNADAVVTRATLIARAWPADAVPAPNLVDTYICRLRVKLTAAGAPDPIVTRRGVGYMLAGETRMPCGRGS